MLGYLLGGLLKKKSVVHDFLILFWFVAWISTPDSEAVMSITALDGYTLIKAILRFLIGVIIFFIILFNWKNIKKRINLMILLPIIYVILNLAILPKSEVFFYSAYRIFEFILLWLSALLFLENVQYDVDLFQKITHFFEILSLICFSLLIVYFVWPEWGSKASGFDPISGEAVSHRLGGSFLRVDLVASLGGCVFLFWVLMDAKNCGLLKRSLGVTMGLSVVIFSHSRTAIFVLLVLLILSAFRKGSRTILLIIIFIILTLFFFFGDQGIEFILRGSSADEISGLNGRLAIWSSVINANNWLSILFGNGYLMNTPDGLFFYTPDVGRYMNQPHNGYLSVLLGSGIIGIMLIILMYIAYIRKALQLSGCLHNMKKLVIVILLFLSSSTIMDYGIWGITSPAMLIFSFLYITLSIKYKRR